VKVVEKEGLAGSAAATLKKVSSVSRRANQREEGWPDRRESDETVQ
jgi:hypothetical protein